MNYPIETQYRVAYLFGSISDRKGVLDKLHQDPSQVDEPVKAAIAYNVTYGPPEVQEVAARLAVKIGMVTEPVNS